MTRRAVQSGNAPAPVGPYSPAIDTGDHVFLSGQLGADPATGELPDGVAAQAEWVMRNVTTLLEAAGLSMNDVVKTTCFLADMNDFAAFNEVYGRFVGDPPPARSTFAVAGLPKGARVEVEAIAVRSKS